MSITKYTHNEAIHEMASPQVLVPIFVEMFSPTNVCDVGCGIGNFLRVFKSYGVKKVMGYDGNWVDRNLLSKYIEPNEFRTINFENTLPQTTEKFDLALCLEVAEHVSHEKSYELISFLTKLSDTVIFSAAIPFQGGENHINEQWEQYWEERFGMFGFKKYDIIRYKIFANDAIQWWYRQNIVVYSKSDLSMFPEVKLTNIVMPQLYWNKVNDIYALANRVNL